MYTDAPAGAPADTVLVDGEWTGAATTFDVVDPATLRTIGRAADAGPAEAALAVDAAARAFPGWRAVPVEERSALLRAGAAAVRADADELADLMVAENGKPRAEAVAEIGNCARMIEWAAEQARRADGAVLPPAAHGPALTTRFPVGPVYAIAPWNFPGSMLVRKIALALAAGCTVVAKPSELTPLVGVGLVRRIAGAGLPPGVLNVLTTTDPQAVTDVLLADRRLRKISFTGSTRVGLGLAAAAHGHLRRVSLELGGHSPAVVLPDADLDAAAQRIVLAKFANAGQSCTAINRVYVHELQVDELVERIAELVRALPVGRGTDPATRVGPLISETALTKVADQVEQAVRAGAKAVVGGGRAELTDPDLRGAFYAPTVLREVTAEMDVVRHETFGPVLPILTYTDVAAALAAANDSEYGLAAYLFGRDLAATWQAAEALEFGVVGVNDPFPVRPELPFGGVRNSGQEREGGSEGIDAYLETRAISFRW